MSLLICVSACWLLPGYEVAEFSNKSEFQNSYMTNLTKN